MATMASRSPRRSALRRSWSPSVARRAGWVIGTSVRDMSALSRAGRGRARGGVGQPARVGDDVPQLRAGWEAGDAARGQALDGVVGDRAAGHDGDVDAGLLERVEDALDDLDAAA